MMIRSAIPSSALGHPHVHGIHEKLKLIAEYGFDGVEIVYEEVEHLAAELPGGLTHENMLEAAQDIRDACKSHGIDVVCLQPFRSYDGLADRNMHRAKLREFRLWFQVAGMLGTDLIQMPTNFLRQGTVGDPEIIADDMRELADMGLQNNPVIRFAYEAVAWGTHIDTWEGAWDIIQRVDRPNLGLCLDTFHIAGRVWADPTVVSGEREAGEEALRTSLKRLVKEVDINKVFYLQVSDGEKMDPPLDGETYKTNLDMMVPGLFWSRNARLFPYEQDRGGYFPIHAIMSVILNDLKYDGWISLEMFSKSLNAPEAELPVEQARRAQKSWQKFSQQYKLK